MKLVVDFDKCAGLGICESIDPDRFQMDDGGNLVLLRAEVDDHELPLVEDAISGCPTEAWHNPALDRRQRPEHWSSATEQGAAASERDHEVPDADQAWRHLGRSLRVRGRSTPDRDDRMSVTVRNSTPREVFRAFATREFREFVDRACQSR